MINSKIQTQISTADLVPLSALQREAGKIMERRKKDLLTALEKMLPQIIRGYRPEKIILFGSMATGKVSASSDLDLVLIKKTGRRPMDRQKDLLKIAQPGIATDFFIYTPAEFKRGLKEKKHFFETEILKNGKVLYDKAA